MKKRNLWIKMLVAIIFLSAIIYLIKVYYFEKNYEHLDKKYAHFQKFSTDYKSKDFVVEVLCESNSRPGSDPFPISVYASFNNEIIAVCYSVNQKDKDVANFYKVDENGNTIDSLSLDAEDKFPYFAGEFIFYSESNERKTYNTWPKNGDSTERNIEFINQDYTLAKEKIAALIADAKSSSQFYFFDEKNDNGVSIKQFYYYKNEKWQVILEKMKDYYSPAYEETYEKLNKELLRTGEDSPYLAKEINLIHFYKKTKIRYAHNGGGGGGGFYVKNWRGNGYFTIIIGGKNFDYFIPNLVIEKEIFDNYQNRFYLVPEENYRGLQLSTEVFISPFGFALFTNGENVLYVIKSKK